MPTDGPLWGPIRVKSHFVGDKRGKTIREKGRPEHNSSYMKNVPRWTAKPKCKKVAQLFDEKMAWAKMENPPKDKSVTCIRLPRPGTMLSESERIKTGVEEHSAPKPKGSLLTRLQSFVGACGAPKN